MGTRTRTWTWKESNDPIEAQFGPLRMFTMANSDYPNHVMLARDMHAYRRNANARHADVIAAQRRERARGRSERHQRWGRPHAQVAGSVR
jgi:hypothetical protein